MLVTCRKCGAQISHETRICPWCATRNPGRIIPRTGHEKIVYELDQKQKEQEQKNLERQWLGRRVRAKSSLACHGCGRPLRNVQVVRVEFMLVVQCASCGLERSLFSDEVERAGVGTG